MAASPSHTGQPPRPAPSAMPSKVAAVVENWFPRFLANGLDYLDVRRMLDRIDDWADWAPVWTSEAERYAELGADALAAGHRVTGADHLRRAALTLQFAQFVLTEQPELRRTLRLRQQQLYAECAPLLEPPAHRVAFPAGGDAAAGYLRVPACASASAPGLVVLLPGLESTKEQFSTYESFFLERGVATLSLEGPGQGAHPRPFRATSYTEAMAVVAHHLHDHLADRLAGTDVPRPDPDRVVVLGTSFGGHLALRHASVFRGLRGVVDIAGPYDLRGFDDLQRVTRESLAEFVAVGSPERAKQLLADVTLETALTQLEVPVLVVHGEADTIISVDHAYRIAAELGARAELGLYPLGNHSCNNIATVVRPRVADWVADRLED